MELKNVFDSIRMSKNPIIEGFSDIEDVFNSFNVSQDIRGFAEIIYANYETGDYDGAATVFYYRSDTEKYYETYGSHCSCYGLEECEWQMEEIVFKELEKRFKPELFLRG